MFAKETRGNIHISSNASTLQRFGEVLNFFSMCIKWFVTPNSVA